MSTYEELIAENDTQSIAVVTTSSGLQGNIASSSERSGCAGGVSNPNHVTEREDRHHAEKCDSDYREAAIYLEEGENNDKLSGHPESAAKLKYYFFAHSRLFNSVILIASIGILALGLLDGAAEPLLPVNSVTSALLELLFLAVFTVELSIRFQWLGARYFVRHVRTVIKTFVVIISYVRAACAIALIGATDTEAHWALRIVGILRALRVIFLLDCQYAGGTRRFARQLVQTLPRIALMLALLGVVTLVFAIIGVYLFADLELSGNADFATLTSSYESLFVLFTASNFPGVMLPSYNVSKWYAWYFIVYLVVAIYIIANLLFAVVYDWFTLLESTKLKKLLMHRRLACELAFAKLACRNGDEPLHVPLVRFQGLLRFYRPSMRGIDTYLAFKALIRDRNRLISQNALCYDEHHVPTVGSVLYNTDDNVEAEFATELELHAAERLTLELFYGVYEVTRLRWQAWHIKLDTIWHERLSRVRLRAALDRLRAAVESNAMEWLINATVAINCALLLTASIDVAHGQVVTCGFDSLWLSVAFTIVYLLEIFLKLVALGTRRFFASSCNIYDLTVVSAIATVTFADWLDEQLTGTHLVPDALVLALQPLRLFRVVNALQLYRELVDTLNLLAPRMRSASVVVCLFYYVFGVIGLEVFSHVQLVNCCRNTSFEDYYRRDNSSETQGDYYLLTFDDAVSVCVTLFHLMMVNDWYITMSAYTIVTGTAWTRFYFISFYLVIMVLVSMIVSFILDAFVFRMRLSRSDFISTNRRVCRVELSLSHADYIACAATEARGRTVAPCANVHARDFVPARFIGERHREAFEFSLQMHANAVAAWLHEFEVVG